MASTERTVELPATVADDDLASGGPAPVDTDPRFIGRFRVLRKLGEGGMGRVYEAEDPELRRRVAVKLIAGTSSAAAVARLRREAQSLAAISHPNVVVVHEVGVHDGAMFVAMEYVQGATLRDWISDDFRDWRAVLEVFVQAARGLEAAHKDGLVHRDFKPDNVMIGEDHRVRVLDFGIAKAVSTATADGGHDPDATLDPTGELALQPGPSSAPHSSTALTRTGLVMGTPRYMAPEQFDGRDVDGRTDQFAFCVALYEALFRLRPFGGNSLPALAEAVSEGAVRPIPPDHPVPAPLRRVVLRGLSPEPADRFPDMAALRTALEASLRGPTTASSLAPAARTRELSGGAFVLIAVGAVAVVVGAAIGARQLWPTPPTTPDAAAAGADVKPQPAVPPETQRTNRDTRPDEPEPLVSPPFSAKPRAPEPAPQPTPSAPRSAPDAAPQPAAKPAPRPRAYPPPPPYGHPPPPPPGHPPPPPPPRGHPPPRR